jgi:hypothetical protein
MTSDTNNLVTTSVAVPSSVSLSSFLSSAPWLFLRGMGESTFYMLEYFQILLTSFANVRHGHSGSRRDWDSFPLCPNFSFEDRPQVQSQLATRKREARLLLVSLTTNRNNATLVQRRLAHRSSLRYRVKSRAITPRSYLTNL